ncbi:alpha/beta fold hydrolase [Nonomuraea dietziae]|uniref:alpha/beta fold hydrolase n=1 Tax=Nonomuraea dietziae TaxID=65515 RepID=UPI0031D748B5
MKTATPPLSRRLLRSARTVATVMLTLLLAMGIAACSTPTATNVAPYAVATQDDPEFKKTFRHEFADVDGVRMHYVTGGSGTPVVLIHGWPQTWYGWWPIMPALAEHHTVYAVDLPGLGDSNGSPTGYDKATLARYVHTLIADRLKIRDAAVVGHDFGAAVAFQYASQFPDDTARLGYFDLPLAGPAIDASTYRSLSWHIAFHSQRRVPEAVVADDVREYLALFYPQVSFGGTAFGGTSDRSPFTDTEINEYARTYSRPGGPVWRLRALSRPRQGRPRHSGSGTGTCPDAAHDRPGAARRDPLHRGPAHDQDRTRGGRAARRALARRGEPPVRHRGAGAFP